MGSKQMQQIRMSLRGKAVVLMGKNTMMRKAIRGHLENNPALEKSVHSLGHLCLPLCPSPFSWGRMVLKVDRLSVNFSL